jgi:hypothetical protein
MKKIALILMCSSFLMACDSKKNTDSKPILLQSDTLKYNLLEAKAEVGNCDSLYCAKAKIEYLVVDTSTFQGKKIHQFVSNELLYSSFDVGKKYTNHTEIVNEFVAKFNQSLAEVKKEIKANKRNNHIAWLNWEMLRKTEVLRNGNGIFTVMITDYEYTGGAHGLTTQAVFNFNTLTGDTISLNSLFEKSNLEQLTLLADAKFRAEAGLMDVQSYSEAGYFIENNQLPLTRNFAITDSGLTFIYNPYEIGPYSMGNIVFHLPTSQFEKLVKTTFLLWFSPKNPI